MQAALKNHWGRAPAVQKAQAVTLTVAVFVAIASFVTVINTQAASSAVAMAKFTLLTSTFALIVGAVACLLKRGMSYRTTLLKVAIVVAVASGVLAALVWSIHQSALGLPLGALCAVMALAGVTLWVPVRGRAGVAEVAGKRASALVPRSQLVPVECDAGVGMHLKYDRLITPQVTWRADFVGMDGLQYQVRKATFAIHSPWYKRAPTDPMPTNAPNGILLNGDPGNGKTFIAELVAGSHGYPLFTMTASEFSSQWVGEGNKALAAAFELVKRNYPCVLFIDEIDSFVSARNARSSGGVAEQELTTMVNIFLTELVELRKFPVIIIGATNHGDKIDPAIAREGRFDFKIQVDNPDQAARVHLLKRSLQKSVPDATINWEEVERAAARFNGFNAKRILTIGERVADVIPKSKTKTVGRDVLMAALREVQGTMGRIPENALPLSEIVLTAQTREQVENLLTDFKMVGELEEFGGDMVRGVLFYGPPGTGKTTVAKTIAKESDWGFLSTTGPDLVADSKKLQEIFEKAKSLRPCVIFIDEADQVLKDRTVSAYPEVTNKLLTIMEGIEDAVKDVVFIAATNHPEQIDAALLRTGRFTGKVEFQNPGAEELEKLVRIWFDKRKEKVALDSQVNLTELLERGGFSQANVQGVLQTALNNAIRSRSITDRRAVISNEHIDKALEFIQA